MVMTKREILINYRAIVIDISTLERHLSFLISHGIGGPSGVRAVQLTGMPRGTNDPEAAAIQRADYDDEITLRNIQEQSEKLRGLLGEFEKIMNSIVDMRTRDIMRKYYALGQSDEEIALEWDLTQQRVNQIRTEALEALDR